MMRHKEQISLEGLRQDGRRPGELRRITFSMGSFVLRICTNCIKKGVNNKANGSAICEMGCTKVIALVDGPKQLQQKEESAKGKINCTIFMTNFATAQHKDNPKRQLKMRDVAQVIRDVFETMVTLEQYAMSQIDIHIIVLQNDGGYKSAAINAATLALIDAGINMKDLMVSSTAGFVDGICCSDLLYAEEKKEGSSVSVAYAPAKGKLAHMSVISPKMSTTSLATSIDTAIEGCKQIYGKIKTYIREYMSTHYHT